MFDKRIFFLAGGALTVYQWRKGRLVDPMVFRADEDGLTRFSLYLDRDSRTTAYVLVDFVEEEFREETLPHVLGGDRQALVKSKTNRLFRDATYSHAIFQGREAEGRRDDKVLFTALIRPDLLRPWMGQMARRNVPVAGIYSLPIFSEALLRKLTSTSTHALLVTTQSGGGLRQTFFHQQQLKVSRLAVMQQVEKRAQASYILGEVEKVRRYLSSLRLLTRDSPLDVFILHHGQVLADLKQQAVDEITTHYHLLDVTDTAHSVGLKERLDSPYSDQIFAYLLNQKLLGNHYANPGEMKYFHLNLGRLGMHAASALLLLGALVWSGVQLVQGMMAQEEVRLLAGQASSYEKQYQRAKERFPPAPADGANIKLAVEAVAKLKQYKTTPLDMMFTLSQGMSRFPNLQIDEIDWVASADRDQSADAQRTGAGGGPAIQRPAAGTAETPEMSFQLAHVKGRVERFAGDYRAAMDQVGRFADTLEALEGVEKVRVLRLPLNLSSEQSLSGTAGAEVVVGTAEFELQVMLRAKPA